MHKKNIKKLNIKPRIEHELKKDQNNPIDAWRIFKIMSEFVEGFEMIRRYDKAATFFGSARCGMEDAMYKNATELASRLSKDQFTIITGGGPGIMEAANRGGFQAGGRSVGLNIELPMEQKINPSVHESMPFHYFFTRKVMLSFASDVYIYFPGGFGTFDEFFEIITLIQTKKINRVPVILYGKDFWQPVIDLFEKQLLQDFKTISKADLELFTLVDSVDEAYDAIMKQVWEYCEKDGAC